MIRLQPRYAIPVVVLGLLLGGPSVAQVTAAASGSTVSPAGSAFTLSDYERLAARGDANAAEQAGRLLFDGYAPNGKVVARDVVRARSYLSQAAKTGSPTARALVERIDASKMPASDGEYVPGPFGC